MKPRLNPHNHKESKCKICINYINKLNQYRQSITGGEVVSKIVFRLGVTSHSNNTKRGKRKFDLPKPVLVGPLTLS